MAALKVAEGSDSRLMADLPNENSLNLIWNRPRSRRQNHLAVLRGLFHGAERIVICSGWLKAEGVKALSSELKEAVARGAHIIVYSNRPGKETEIRAISMLREMGIEHIAVEHTFYLHTKIYFFQAGETYRAMIGSANITDGGLRTNEELSVMLEGHAGDRHHREVLAYLRHIDRRCQRATIHTNEEQAPAEGD